MDQGITLDRRIAHRTSLAEILERYRREVTRTKRGAVDENLRLKAMAQRSFARIRMSSLTSSLLAAAWPSVSASQLITPASMLLKIRSISPFGPATNPSMDTDILRMTSLIGCKVGAITQSRGGEMDTGTIFPAEVAELICCPAEGRRLTIGEVLRGDATGVRDGNLRCPACAATYPIDDGILCMFERGSLHPESLHEVTTRDQRAAKADAAITPWATDDDEAEFIPTLAALAPGPADSIFELGCGNGRYTVGLVGRCRLLVPLDFSQSSLRVLQRRLPSGTRIGLINADVTTFKAAPQSFDKVFSTLVSNLPTRAHRDALYRLAATAVRGSGAFIYSVHHYGLKERLKGVVKSGLYGPGDIYRYLQTISETRQEIQAYFRKARVKSIQIYLPLWRRLRLPVSALSSFLEKVPLVSRWGTMLLCVASSPVQTD
jgi:uncharacterized protein YbaR (Trm112 family)